MSHEKLQALTFDHQVFLNLVQRDFSSNGFRTNRYWGIQC
jgi:hypothetical protein